MNHKILYNEYQEPSGLTKTTHPDVTFDELAEMFIVDLKEGGWCEVFGFNRFSNAIKIAELYEKEEINGK